MAFTLLSPWRGSRVWRCLAYVSLDWLIGSVTFSIVGTFLVAAIGVIPTVVLIVPIAWLLFATSARLGTIERSRVASLLSIDLSSPHPSLLAASRRRRMLERARTRSRWVEIVYLVLVLPLLAALGIIAAALWAGSLALLGLPAYLSRLAGGEAHFYFFVVGPGRTVWWAAAAGLVGLVLVAPWATVAVADIDGAVARRMLGPSPRLAMAEQMRMTEVRREAAVESADSERRRIERDLHDGAQQRLVALAMDLGRAREQFDADPDRARSLIADAHDEAKAALGELRDLVRGVHPAILTDRGLDAALSAVVARCPVPVDLTVDVGARAPAAIESAAYFVVTEALTNSVRHAGASRIKVAVVTAAGRLVVEVTDNGIGGADPARGTGLTGLSGRVESLGGWLRVVSPAGGPTTILAELPCGS